MITPYCSGGYIAFVVIKSKKTPRVKYKYIESMGISTTRSERKKVRKVGIPLNTIAIGDNLVLLKKIHDESIDLIITSPPYYQKRRYDGTSEVSTDGLEESIDEYVDRQIELIREYKRVLTPTGIMLLNYGDTYLSKSSQLIPHRIAIRIQDTFPDLLLRNDIAWVKTSSLPQPNATDRLQCVKESFFFFAKSEDYYWDMSSFLKCGKTVHSLSVNRGSLIEGNRRRVAAADIRPENKEKIMQDLKVLDKEMRDGVVSYFRLLLEGEGKKGIRDNAPRRVDGSEYGRKQYNIVRQRNETKKIDCVVYHPCQERKVKHPARYPTGLIKEFIRLTCPPDGIVLDPYMGSGTTGVAAKLCKRNYIGLEISKTYIQTAKHRIESTMCPIL